MCRRRLRSVASKRQTGRSRPRAPSASRSCARTCRSNRLHEERCSTPRACASPSRTGGRSIAAMWCCSIRSRQRAGRMRHTGSSSPADGEGDAMIVPTNLPEAARGPVRLHPVPAEDVAARAFLWCGHARPPAWTEKGVRSTTPTTTWHRGTTSRSPFALRARPPDRRPRHPSFPLRRRAAAADFNERIYRRHRSGAVAGRRSPLACCAG